MSSYQRCQAGLSRTFQLTSLFPEMSARENCRIAAQARLARRWQPYGGVAVFAEASARGDQALERLGLTAVAERPAGLLSHGDQRLLEVAMALAQQPRILLLDEPTQGLSVEETLTAVETLAGLLADGRLTVLLVEHDMEVVFRLARKITGHAPRPRDRRRCARRGKGRSSGAGRLSGWIRLMLRIEGLNTHYGASHILQGVDLAVPNRPHLRGARPQRRRQDHHGAQHHGTGHRQPPGGSCWTARTSPAGRRIWLPGQGSPTCRKAG